MNRVDRERRRERLPKLALVVLVLASVILLALVAAHATQRFDDRALHSVLDLRTPVLNDTFRGVTRLGSYWVVAIVTLAGAALLYRMKGWRTSVVYASLVAVGSMLSELVKVIIARPRPGFLLDLSGEGYSYPSSHTMAAVCCYLGLAWLLSKNMKGNFTKTAMYSVVLTVVGLVGFSRMYLGWHYPTDVLGSVLMGLCIILSYEIFTSSRGWPE